MTSTLVRLRSALVGPLARGLLGSPRMCAALGRGWVAREPGLDPQIAALLALDARTGDSRAWKRSLGAARRSIEMATVLTAPIGDAVEARELQCDGAEGQLRARLYERRNLGPRAPGLLYLHGGGWTVGSVASHDSVCRRLAQVGG